MDMRRQGWRGVYITTLVLQWQHWEAAGNVSGMSRRMIPIHGASTTTLMSLPLEYFRLRAHHFQVLLHVHRHAPMMMTSAPFQCNRSIQAEDDPRSSSTWNIIARSTWPAAYNTNSRACTTAGCCCCCCYWSTTTLLFSSGANKLDHWGSGSAGCTGWVHFPLLMLASGLIKLLIHGNHRFNKDNPKAKCILEHQKARMVRSPSSRGGLQGVHHHHHHVLVLAIPSWFFARTNSTIAHFPHPIHNPTHRWHAQGENTHPPWSCNKFKPLQQAGFVREYYSGFIRFGAHEFPT